MGGEEPGQLVGVFRNAFFGLQILVHDRQRIIGERNAGYVSAL